MCAPPRVWSELENGGSALQSNVQNVSGCMFMSIPFQIPLDCCQKIRRGAIHMDILRQMRPQVLKVSGLGHMRGRNYSSSCEKGSREGNFCEIWNLHEKLVRQSRDGRCRSLVSLALHRHPARDPRFGRISHRPTAVQPGPRLEAGRGGGVGVRNGEEKVRSGAAAGEAPLLPRPAKRAARARGTLHRGRPAAAAACCRGRW
eukprot:363309-Chlamydomonas_euryale.AAC.44